MQNPEKLKRVVIKEELVALVGDSTKALILNQFLYWGERVTDYDKFIIEEKKRNPELDLEPQHGWIYKSSDELSDELMIGLSPASMRRHIQVLVKAGYLDERHNPKYKWDRCLQYRSNIRKIQTDLQALGYALERYPLLIDENAFFKIKNAEPKIKNQTAQNKKAIPETTTETTTEINNNGWRDFCKKYETEIGTFSPIIAQRFQDYVKDCPIDWMINAVDLAAENNVRKASYIYAILENCIANKTPPGTKQANGGKKDGTSRNDQRTTRNGKSGTTRKAQSTRYPAKPNEADKQASIIIIGSD